MNVQATPRQIELLQHTLGLSAEHRNSHRNHFVAGAGHHDMPELQALETLGLMRRAPTPSFCPSDDIVFCATAAGQTIAQDALPAPRVRTRYEDFLDYDGCISFGQYLCGDKLPVFERGQARGDVRWRMVRRVHGAIDVAGAWTPTKKDAKASYKQALAEGSRTKQDRGRR
ncbi:hypothetical protein [Castellaniella sp.]|uniref:hypothetical protein n=1 Tax=Castellaniella sp. TaxID=1955812 RepID=UPI002AFF11F4|nr:hypothetical protein [Castellaniella sp.]